MAAKEQNGKPLIRKMPIFFLFSLLTSVSAQGHSQCGDAFSKNFLRTEIRNEFIASNEFTVNRTLDVYSQHFPFKKTESLKKTVENLPKGSLWVDMGAGRAHALIDGLDLNPNISEGVAIACKKPQGAESGRDFPRRFRYLEGDFVENMGRDGKLDTLKGRVNLITDVFGPISYSEYLPPLLQIYFDLLRPNGLAVFNIMAERNFDKTNTNQLYLVNDPLSVNPVLINGNQNADGIIAWLRTIPGIEIIEAAEYTLMSVEHWEKSYVIKIRKISNEVIIPQTLKTIKYEASSPPKRAFEIVPDQAR